MQSTMQREALGVSRILRSAARFGAARPVHIWDGNTIVTTDMQRTAQRAMRLGAALAARGLTAGDRVATLCAATLEHCEAYLGVPSRGFVLHSLNLRMADDDLARMLCDCGDRVLILDYDQWERFVVLAPALGQSMLDLVLLAGAGPLPASPTAGIEVLSYNTFIEAAPLPDVMALADPPEESAAAICHTGGTTGKPKAVAYSHRSVWLQALSLCLADSLALSRADTALLAVPFYHVNGWGLPYAAVMCGAGLALPGASFRPAVLHRLITECEVTLAAGVPTIWGDYFGHLDVNDAEVPATLTRIATGGSVVPGRLAERIARADVALLQAWGMTETSSMSVVGRASPGTRPAAVGHPGPTVELRRAPVEGTANAPGMPGEIQVRGPCVTRHYLGSEVPACDAEGWLPTGDIGVISADGALSLTDRLKDAIKSGGEWIPAPALEDAIRAVDWIEDVAVIARPHERFQERPFAVVVLKSGACLDLDQLRSALRARVPSWWLPDDWCLVATLPQTTLGKPDKVRLRAMLAAGQLSELSLT